MLMPSPLRKLALTLHIILSVGWLGAAAAYLVVAVAALTSGEAARMQAAYPILELLGWAVIVPLCLAALASGLVQSLGTPWGLIRHYWVLANLGLTAVATAVLLGHMPAVTHAARLAAESAVASVPAGIARGQGAHDAAPVQLLVHAAGGVVVLATITALSVFKPWGLTPYGRKRQRTLAQTVQQARV